MKHYFATAILMAAGLAYANSPAAYDCIYRYDMTGNDSGKEISENYNCILRIGDNESKFYDYLAFRLDSVSATPDVKEAIVDEHMGNLMKAVDYFDQELLTSISDNKLTAFCPMAPNYYKYEQALPLINWTEENDTDTVCGYECRKATGEYGGRQWTVWYAEDISVPFGPWKLSGLPGLVLKAFDTEEIHKFEAISFRKASGEIKPPSYPNVVSIKYDKFIERKNIYDKEPFATISPEEITNLTVIKPNTFLINGTRVRQHKNGSIPLEYTPSELKKIQNEESQRPVKGMFDGLKVIGTGTIAK